MPRPAARPPRSSGQAWRRRGTAAGVVLVLAAGGLGLGQWLWDNRTQPLLRETCVAVVDGVEHELAPDQAANAALISAVAVRRGMPARAATIGIATAIQESKLRNIDYGDRDSLGLFQQRPSQGWGTPEQVTDPLYATNAFYDGLAKVEGYETMEITVAAQEVQRSGFPEAYADHEPEGRAFASALTGYSAGTLDCRLREVEPSAADATLRSTAVQQALDTQLGATPWQPQDDPEVLVAPVAPDEGGVRRGWAAAQWAVASADAYDVVRVEVGGRVWDRTSPGDGWVADDGAAPDLLRITVAGTSPG